MKRIFAFIVIAMSFASCKNLVPYTDNMKSQNNWSDDQVRRIQFYVSHQIVLHRELSQGSTEIVSGKIKNINGKRVEEIIIREGTPGVLTEIPRQKKMLVSFEIDDKHFLSFGVNPGMDGKYVLLAEDWEGSVGKVNYAGKKYYTEPDSRYAFLLVDLRKIMKMKTRMRVAKGRRVN